MKAEFLAFLASIVVYEVSTNETQSISTSKTSISQASNQTKLNNLEQQIVLGRDMGN